MARSVCLCLRCCRLSSSQELRPLFSESRQLTAAASFCSGQDEMGIVCAWSTHTVQHRLEHEHVWEVNAQQHRPGCVPPGADAVAFCAVLKVSVLRYICLGTSCGKQPHFSKQKLSKLKMYVIFIDL